MCGFYGYIGKDSKNYEKGIYMLDHRGPDHLGTFSQPSIFLGHRRLSILDLESRSNQPFHFKDRYIAIYNGEIYNYKELRLDLQKSGYSFHTQSDTEVLLALFDQKREKCLNELDGMFAFAIWDKQYETLFCARDRFGEKPFFYFQTDKGFSFGSEIKSILESCGPFSYNKAAINIFLGEKKHINEPETFFKNVFSLLPGHYIYYTEKTGVSIKPYYQIEDHVSEIKSKDLSYNEAVSHFREQFISSVNLRLRADVPVGASLSGGLDSSCVVGVACKTIKNFNCFSAVFPGKVYDESRWIEKVIQFNNLPSFKTEPDLDRYLQEGINVSWHHENPLLTSSNYLQWCVNKMVRANSVKVLLDGQGADEYLGGYKDFKYFAIWDLYNSGKLSQYLNEVKSFKENFDPDEKFGKFHVLDPFLKRIGKTRKELKMADTFKGRMLYSLKYELPHLLRYADRNAMAHAVEVRLPFLDNKLVEFTLSLPNNYLYKDGVTKRVMRDALREFIPNEIYHRKDKIGFVGPKQEWLSNYQFKELLLKANKTLKEKNLNLSEDGWINVSLYYFFLAFDKYANRMD